MGCYNVGCSVSKLSINAGDPVVFIPLEHPRYVKEDSRCPSIGNSTLIYAHCVYAPAALPIIGEYNDYGGVEGIDPNDPMIVFNEQWYGTDIQNLMLPCGETPDNIISGMFVHREIYDELAAKHYGEFGSRKGYGHITVEELMQDASELLIAWKKELEYMEITKTLIDSAENDEKREYWEDRVKENEEKKKHPYILSHHSPFYRHDYITLSEMAIKIAEQGDELLQDFCKFRMFEWGMYAVNAFYFPTMNGYQGGNHFMSKVLYNKALAIARKNCKRGEDDD